MNKDHPSRDDTVAPLPDPLRHGLRALRRDLTPGDDLWTGIAARLEPHASARPAGRSPARGPRRRNAATWLALAASLVAMVGLALQLRPPVPAPRVAAAPAEAPRPVAGPAHAHLLRHADAMTREYDAAFREIAGARPTPTPGPLADLDRSAREIRAALARAPESRLLLEQLRRVHARRLELARHPA